MIHAPCPHPPFPTCQVIIGMAILMASLVLLLAASPHRHRRSGFLQGSSTLAEILLLFVGLVNLR